MLKENGKRALETKNNFFLYPSGLVIPQRIISEQYRILTIDKIIVAMVRIWWKREG